MGRVLIGHTFHLNPTRVEEIYEEQEKLVFLFKGWLFKYPFYCMRCGVETLARQWAFGRACGACDCGKGPKTKLGYKEWYSGPVELVNPFDPFFLAASERRDPPGP